MDNNTLTYYITTFCNGSKYEPILQKTIKSIIDNI